MLNAYFDETTWRYWLVSGTACLSIIALLITCICSCRRHENKNEFDGLPGMVTLSNSDNEAFDRPSTSESSRAAAQEATDSGKRATTANRSLPDIPKDKNAGDGAKAETEIRDDIYETTEAIGDTSELYATVPDKATLELDAEPRGSSIELKAVNRTNSGRSYNRFNNHDSTSDEHPYAQLQSIQRNETTNPQNRTNSGIQGTDDAKASTSLDTSGNNGNPVAPPRTRKSSSHNSLMGAEGSVPAEIQAANAISGSIQANQDLPYMTPPILIPLPHPPQSHQNNSQQHFSGDSQDSKGYTSISVREPLANIIAQTKAAQQQQQPLRMLVDPHYATVSDDSDEMYAAIDEQDKIYTSGSETYAQIQPAAPEVPRNFPNDHISQNAVRPEDSSQTLAPQPPSVDSLRHVAHAHSRQASSSSANSSIINPGSPKPEKRQANSPLPPPPESTTNDTYASVDKRGKGGGGGDERSKSTPVSSGKSLEDMYAKVMKRKRDTEELQPSVHSESGPSTRKLSLVEVSRASWSSHDSVEIQKKEENDEVEPQAPPEPEANHSKDGFGYETLEDNRKSVPSGFGGSSEAASEMFPTSPFKHRQVSNASSEDPGYEKVRLRRNVELDQDTDSEPNYESMPHEPNYASVCRPGDSDIDPNYESVNHVDPNYESVKYLNSSQPEDPPYEQVSHYSKASSSQEKTSEPDYERISARQTKDSGDTDDEQYVQV